MRVNFGGGVLHWLVLQRSKRFRSCALCFKCLFSRLLAASVTPTMYAREPAKAGQEQSPGPSPKWLLWSAWGLLLQPFLFDECFYYWKDLARVVCPPETDYDS